MPWSVSSTCPINPVHAALLRTGKVLFFSGSGNNPNDILNAPQGSALYDVTNGTFTRPEIPRDSNGNPIDVFCAGQAFLSGGNLLVAGGTLRYDPFFGLVDSFFFSPTQQKWIKRQSMNSGRWYPTLVTLGNGQIFAISGLDENGNLNSNPELYSSSRGWRAFTQSTSPIEQYAHIYLLDNGKLFYAGAQLGGNRGVSPRILTLPKTFTDPIGEQPVGGLQDANNGNQAASVLLPPAQDQKVMIIGGGGNGTTARVNIVDLKSSNPSYQPAASLNNSRMHHNAVILPNRTVFVCNGSGGNEDVGKSDLPAEIYDPATDTWTEVEDPIINGRVYHSVALLLPDGRVLTAGGNPFRGSVEFRIEIYSPDYIAQGRPVISNAPSTAKWGTSFTIETPQAGDIKWVNLIKPMATTHGLETEQRLVDVPVSSTTGNTLTVDLTSNRNLAPPGWYMLTIVNNNNVPSLAKWVTVRG
ncbi:galactose oxidase-like domain-containing protein [Rivularia sp. UHCC 0363]|uniref:galactose oxidase-like domain-containing protein n=1 Tax=Rivularia sp. UHCC 0363 TaxID=3110244 RepID=UPI002B2112EB|nr:galactose oxidase-like domain-containing protein [Rivularia sp. UHCC 0363]MEA5598700.1 galactose oxidase-like domain-containing protein [Rivularia sp. UHCC 0363]